MTTDLLGASLGELMAEARAIRGARTGNRVTYSPKVFIPLTELCRDRCGYCTFAKPPARLESPFMAPEQVLDVARAGAFVGAHEALFTLGEAPEARYPVAAEWLSARGYSSTIDYLVAMCALVRDESGLLPHSNAGAVSEADLIRLREVSASQGMMIESLNANLACHRGAPDKTPERRLATLEAAGRLSIPFTTGILVGIGESRRDRIEALEAIAASHRRHGHVQEVIVQPFLPKADTSMHAALPCTEDELLWSIAAARLLLPSDVHLQAPPNLVGDLASVLEAGIDDWGGVSAVTPDHVNPERPWPAVELLREATEASGLTLAPRLTIYPEFALKPDRWLASSMRTAVLHRADAEALGRDHPWASGSEIEPPVVLPTGRSIPSIRRKDAAGSEEGGRVREVLEGIAAGQEPGVEEITTLFEARGPEVRRVAAAANAMREELVGDAVTWVSNRNINYTNVCTFKCKFCAFSKGPLSLNLRGSPYLLTLDEITTRVAEAEQMGATEVCLQGGIHPSFDGDYYIDVIAAVRAASPTIHIHGFTALEVTEGARRLGVDLDDYLIRLKAAGLASLPGTAAEILDDEIRAVLCPDKIDTQEWLDCHRAAHRVGLGSNVTIMFGAIEQPVNWARHIVRTRDLQKETGGFTEFVPLPFVHMATPIWLQGKARPGPTFREALLMHAVARLAYGPLIPNIQASWVKLGVAGSAQTLRAGVNDLGGTLINENISRAAGASHGQEMDASSFGAIVQAANEADGGSRRLEQRTTRYGRLPIPA
ncbi:MAG TPA: 5-amino-6-(D-ribitylamino)uracil--L-tyrosine 4-hydroxyphenyl transferase CofH [Acidimicrobiales bacterium]|nr:5-amino-6-(D-ribitylamino)uracil--L-tyrosine 4-hydroxyphenyl transferase CofH [Acidimicrobiales bacterium]